MKIIGGDMNPLCVGQHFVDKFWLMRPLEELSIDEFSSYCSRNGVFCVFPTRDLELVFFSKNKARLAAEGIHVMVADLDVVRLCNDKLRFSRRLVKLGFPVIPASQNIREIHSSLYVVKERVGTGSKGLAVKKTKLQALKCAEKLQRPIFQPFISGKEVSIDLYVDLKGKTRGMVSRSRDLIINGAAYVTTTFRAPQLERLCSDIAETMHLYGHNVIQVLIDEREDYHVIECNPRWGSASSISPKVGLESLYWCLLEASGKNLDAYPFKRALVEKRQVLYWEHLVL